MSSLKLKNAIGTKAEQHPFHVVDASPLPLFMSVAIVLGLRHVAILSHPEFPIADQGVFLGKIRSGWMNPVATLGWFVTFRFLLAF